MHTYGLTYGQPIICFDRVELGANFTLREVASSANSYANCHYDIYQDTFYSLGFHDSILLVFNLPDSSVSS